MDLFSDNSLEEFRPLDDLEAWIPGQVGLPTTNHGVNTFGLNVESPCLIAGLVERGRYSCQPYQPDVNHRPVNYNTFHKMTYDEKKAPQTPLIESMVKPDSTTSFSNGDFIGIHFYEIVNGSAPNPEQRLQSGNTLLVPFEEESDFVGMEFIKDRYSQPVSNRCLKQFLRFFNLKWTKKNGEKEMDDEEPVSLEVLAALAKTFGDIDMTTHDDMEKFIKKFKLEPIFHVDRHKTMEQNRYAFFQLMNCYTQLRISVFDGKHRVFEILCFCIGYYHMYDQITLGQSPLENFEDQVTFASIKKEDVVYEKMACFVGQIISVGAPLDSTTERLESRTHPEEGCYNAG